MRRERPFIQEAERTENNLENAQAPVTLVLVDGSSQNRHGIRILLDCDPDTRLIGEAKAGDEVFSLMTRLQPDTAILDARLRNSDWINVRHAINTLAPDTKILVFTTTNGSETTNFPAILGLRSSLIKASQVTEGSRTVYDLTTGKIVPHSDLTGESSEIQEEKENLPASQGVDQALTSREAEVLEHIARGLRDREIAETLGISSRTVETHVRNLLRKLGATSRLQALLYAVKSGWL